MKKIIIFTSILIILISQISIAEIEKKDISKEIYYCNVEIYGKVQFCNQPINISIGEKSFIIFLSMYFVDGSEVTVKLENEVIKFDYSGKMKIFGFFGIYNKNLDEDPTDGKKYINLKGKALYTIIEGKKFEKIDNYYIPILENLDNIIHTLDKSPLELSDEDIECLSYLEESKIVGLGEATHGTKEFFQLKHRIFRYLVENHDFNIFAFEVDLAGSYYVDRYISKGKGNIDEIMSDKMHFPWQTEEIKLLIQWMKEYNEYKSDEKKIHFIGIDCQLFAHHSDIIINYFFQANVSLSRDNLLFLNKISQIENSIIVDYYSKISLEEKEEIDDNVNDLLDKINTSKDDFISASSKFEYQFVKRIILNIKQINENWYSYNNNFNYIIRDFYMAQNALWASDLFNENTKVALWAHNCHNMNYSKLRPFGSMGFILKEELNNDYQIINFAFSFGCFTAMNVTDNYNISTFYISLEPLKDSINYVFHHSQDKNFIFKGSDIVEGSKIDLWISKPRKFLDIGSGFNEENLLNYYHNIEFKEHFDVLIYWDITTASEHLFISDIQSNNYKWEK
jgi:erythromycin esterase